MSRQAEIDNMIYIATREGYVLPEIIAEHLVDNGIRSKDGFEVVSNRMKSMSETRRYRAQLELEIQPKQYKDDK